MQEKIKIENGIKYQSSFGQHERMVRQQKARNEYGLRVIDEREIYLRGLLASFSSANNLLTATSTKSLREKYLFFDVPITLSIWSRMVRSLKFCECRRYFDLGILSPVAFFIERIAIRVPCEVRNKIPGDIADIPGLRIIQEKLFIINHERIMQAVGICQKA